MEQSRFDVLLDKYTSKKKDKKSGKEIKPVMDNLIGQAKFRIASSLYLEVLRLAGEENYL
jgi:predicted nucleic acid-binding protein